MLISYPGGPWKGSGWPTTYMAPSTLAPASTMKVTLAPADAFGEEGGGGGTGATPGG